VTSGDGDGQRRVGVYGKIPAQGDFLRLNASTPAVLALDDWHQQAIEALRRLDGAALAGPVRFFFRAPGSRSAIIGVFAPSHDSVGRKFPLSIFAQLDATEIAGFSTLPCAYAGFLTGAEALLEETSGLSGRDLLERARSLPLPSAADADAACGWLARVLEGRPGAPGNEITPFAEPAAQTVAYALRTFLTACEPARAREPAKAAVVLDCPAPSDDWLAVWLELARRRLGWRDAAPCFLWTSGITGRLLLSLGPASSTLLVALARPAAAGSKLWPLTTERPAALASAASALTTRQRLAIEQSAPFEELVSSFVD
jgi:type VI secretion system protein ImpM